MSKQPPSPLSVMLGEVAGLVRKGEAAPEPAAAIAVPEPPPAPPDPAPPARVARPKAAPAARARGPLQRPARQFERRYSPEPVPRAHARVQLGFRIDPERHEQLLRIAYEVRQPVQVIIQEALYAWMDEFDAGEGGS